MNDATSSAGLEAQLAQAPPDRTLVRYLIETPHPVERVASALAAEGSTGTFVAVPGESASVKQRFGTRLEGVRELGQTDRPQLVGARGPGVAEGRYNRAEVTISVPLELTGTDLTSVLASLCGNVYELAEASAFRLVDVAFPEALMRACPRPRHGVGGTRALTGVEGRPLLGSIIRPGVGLTPQETAERVRELLDAGVDFLKDDELMASPPYSPLEARVEAVMRVVDEHEQRTGRRAMYAFNVTADADGLLRNHDLVRAHGGTCVQVNVVQAGLPALARLRRHGDLAIHVHRAGWSAWTRAAGLGMEYRVWQAFCRLAGGDHMIVAGPANKYWETDEMGAEATRACLTPLLDAQDRALPVVAAGQWGGQIPDAHAAAGGPDFLYLAGAGVTGHPGGPAAGVRALQQAWEAAQAGIPLAQHASSAPELSASLRAFGRGITVLAGAR